MGIQDILDLLAESYPKKVSFNTVYRHLTLFVECNLAVMLHDNFKRSYYALLEETPLMVSLCRRCGKIERLEIDSSAIDMSLSPSDLISVHRCCAKCRCCE